MYRLTFLCSLASLLKLDDKALIAAVLGFILYLFRIVFQFSNRKYDGIFSDTLLLMFMAFDLVLCGTQQSIRDVGVLVAVCTTVIYFIFFFFSRRWEVKDNR